jgi:hypothetical protein
MKFIVRLKGGAGSGFHGHAGRPGKVGGSTSGSISIDAAQSIANKLVELHNKAGKEYKVVFKRVGARMWHDDYAHPNMKQENADFMAKEMARMPFDSTFKIYLKYPFERPLTVLDSYPGVTKARRRWLDKEVDSIHKKYTDMFNEHYRGIINS